MELFRTEKIADGSYMISYSIKELNALCYLVEGSESALLIDTMLGAGSLRDLCAALTDKPVKVVNTHGHPDHVLGNFEFDSCYIHPLDMHMLRELTDLTAQMLKDFAVNDVPPMYRDMITDDMFRDCHPIKAYPLYDGDVFDLGGKKIEVVGAGGHTAGSVMFIDTDTRIAYSGDACNGNTLLEFDHSLPVIGYLRTLLRLKEHQHKFDMMYGGHEVFDASIIDEGIETAARVVAGTDDRCERTGMTGGTVYYAAEKVAGGYARKDGKRFNMSYLPDRVLS